MFVLRHGFPNRQALYETKAAPFLWPTWRRGTPEWQIVDIESYIEEGFNQNTLIYSAVMYKVRANTAAPLRAYTGDPESPDRLPPDAPLSKLIARPNPHQSWVEFQGQNVTYLNVAGNAYILMDRGRRGQGLPEAMYGLRPDRVFIVPNEDGHGLMGYLYVPEGASAWRHMQREERLNALTRDANPAMLIVPEDMMHVKLPNPGDPLEGMGYGLSPIAPMARSGDVDNKITKFLGDFFDSGAMPSGILKFNVPLQDVEIARIRERWKEIYGGSENWDEIGILDSGGEYQRLGFSFEEMGFTNLDERNESRILGPFGVPPILIGSRIGLSRATYANYREARQAFWQDTMVPELLLFETEYEYYLQDGNAFVRFDTAKVPALMEVKVGLVGAWQALVDRGVPKSQAAEAVGLDLGALPDGDVVWMPGSVVPVLDPSGQLPKPEPPPETKPEAEAEGESEPEPEPPESPGPGPASPTPGETNEGAAEAEEDTREKALDLMAMLIKEKVEDKPRPTWTAEQKLDHWKAIDQLATDHEPPLVGAARICFERDRREVLALLNEAKGVAVRRKATVDWQALLLEWQDYFRMAGTQWRETFVPLFEAIIQAQGERWAAELGLSFDVRNLGAEQWFQDYTLTFADPILSTTEKDLSALLERAKREGWSIPQMQKAIEALFTQYLGDRSLTDEERAWFEERLPAYRLENIARTESLRASNLSSFELFKEWDAPLKEWLATYDPPRARVTHMEAGRAYGEGGDPGPIPIDEPFIVDGEKMMYPHDPSASPANFCNCRCSLAPAWPPGQKPGEPPAKGMKGGPGSGNYGHRGRPGLRGGSAGIGQLIHVAKGQRRQVRIGIDEVLSHGLETGYEAACAVGFDGQKINGTAKGDKNSVFIPNEFCKGAVLVHNHPISSSFSPEDVGFLFEPYSNIRTLIVVGHDGTMYRMSHTLKSLSSHNRAPVNPTDVVDSWNARRGGALLSKYTAKVASGEMSGGAAWKEHSHEIMVQVANVYHLSYERVLP